MKVHAPESESDPSPEDLCSKINSLQLDEKSTADLNNVLTKLDETSTADLNSVLTKLDEKSTAGLNSVLTKLDEKSTAGLNSVLTKLDEKSTADLDSVLTKLENLQVNERGPERNRDQRTSTFPYERHCTSRLLLSGGTEINSSFSSPRLFFRDGPDIRTSYVQHIGQYEKPKDDLDEIVEHISQYEPVEEPKDDFDEILKLDTVEGEAVYHGIQQLCRELEESCCKQQPSSDIPDDVLDMVFEKESNTSINLPVNISNHAPTPANTITTLTSVMPLRVSICNPQLTHPAYGNRKLHPIIPKLDLHNNLQDNIQEKALCDKKKDILKDKYLKKFLRYDREVGLGSRDNNNRTILMINIMNKKAGFAIYLVTKIHNCFQRRQLNRLRGIESTESYINLKDNEDRTALFYAALYNLPEVVKCLASFKADLNWADMQEGDTPLHVAAKRGSRYADVVKELCCYNDLNIHARNKNGRTALHVAVESHGIIHEDKTENMYEKIDCRETVRHLLKKAKLTVQDNDGKTPLHLAVEKCNCELIGVLNQSSGDWHNAIDLGDKNGFTALHVAATLTVEKSIQKEMIIELLSRDAKSTAKDSQGRIPAQLVSPDRKDIMQNLKWMWSKEPDCWQDIHV